MAKVGPNAINFAIPEMTGQLLTLTTHPNVQYTQTIQYTASFYSAFVLIEGLLSCGPRLYMI